jgi:hypothetical protein
MSTLNDEPISLIILMYKQSFRLPTLLLLICAEYQEIGLS